MKHKYVRFADLGFILFPFQEKVHHAQVATPFLKAGFKLVSAGFVIFAPDGSPTCFGESETLYVGSRREDTSLLEKQLSIHS